MNDFPMELVSLIVVVLAVTVVFLLLILLAGGVAALTSHSFKRYMRKASWLLLLPSVVVAYGVLIERNWFKVNEVTVTDEKVPEAFDGYRIVHISDIHLRSFRGRRARLEKAVRKIQALSPDMIVFTGDLVTMAADETCGLMDVLASLDAPDGVYSVMGNHDYMLYSPDLTEEERCSSVERLRRIEREAGWTMLENSCRNIVRDSSCISVIGIENLTPNPVFPSAGNLDAALEGAEGSFRILLSHDPSAWKEYIAGQRDIDLTLSGHTHDMQLSFPGFSPSSLFYKEHKGLYRQASQFLYVNIGLGETVFPARIGARPEITLIRLACD